MNNKASITALMSAFGRAFHAENEDHPVFADHLAKKLMTAEEYAAVQSYILGGAQFFEPEIDPKKQAPKALLRRLINVHIAPSPLCRAAYTEQALKAAALNGTKQYVMLGAGMDTAALRLPDGMAHFPVFEVDHPRTQQEKLRRIQRAGLTIPQNVRYVPVDFTKDDLTERLLASGFRPKAKSFFSLLGVSYYLTAEQIGNLLDAVSALCVNGSTLVFDYADEGLFSSPVRRVKNMLAMAKAGGEEMQSCFGYTALEKLMETHGFLIYEHLTPQEIQNLCFDGRDDGLNAFEHVCLVTAVCKK